MKYRRPRAQITLSAVLALTMAACSLSSCTSGTNSPDTSTEKVHVLLDWNANPDHLALYAAEHIGAYTSHDVEPQFIVPGNPADAAKEVSLSRADLAISYETDAILARAQGLSVISVGALIPTSLNSLIARKDSGITTAKDLAGKKVALSGLPSQEPSMRYIAERAGIDPGSIEMPNVQQNLSQALISGQVDAIFGAYPNIEGVELAEKMEITTLSAQQLGLPASAELVIIANPTRLEKDASYADRVRRFLASVADGQSTALKDQQQAVDALIPETQGAYDPALLAKMVDATVAILRQSMKQGQAEFGTQDPAAWSAYVEWMRANGLLDTEGGDTQIDGATVMTNDYLPT